MAFKLTPSGARWVPNTITIDPGMNTAIAYWSGGVKEPPTIKVFGCPVKYTSRVDKVSALSDKFLAYISKCRISVAYIEGVEFWEKSEKSRISAKLGKSILLSYIVGAYIRELHNVGITTFELVPREWKGQLTKEAVQCRVNRFYPGHNFGTNHAYDAVGIGLSTMGLL